MSTSVASECSRTVPVRHRARATIAVIGGGISGLAAAHRLRELRPSAQLLLLESGPRLGGVLETVRRDGLVMEGGADSFLAAVPFALDLVRRLGCESQLISPQAENQRTFVVRRGHLRPIPEGFQVMMPRRLWPMATTPILSLWGKLRAAGEFLVPPQPDDTDESLAAFTIRRFGREVFERLVQPMTAGICAGDPERISLRAALPRFAQLERDYGSLLRAAWRQTASANKNSRGTSLFLTPRDGMASLVAALADRLPTGSVCLNAPVTSLSQGSDGGWRLTTGGCDACTHVVDAVIVATPAPAAARLLASVDGKLAHDLSEITYADAASVFLAYRREQIPHPLNGFGFVVPRTEKRRILSVSFVNHKFANRAPDDTILLRVYFGGACATDFLNLSDEQLEQLAADEVSDLLQVRGRPFRGNTIRRPQAMPKYYLGHEERVRQIETRAARLPAFALAGNAHHGAGVPQCIRSGERAAEAVLAKVPCPV